MERFEDKTLQCVECEEDFVFTAGEQRFYFSKQLSQPKRCQQCRDKRRKLLVPQTGRQEEKKDGDD